jgi:excisionase family DNA binding protein
MPKTIPPLTTYEVSRYLHVDLTTVIHWCDQGKLQAYKTPGGHRRVQAESLLSFLKEYGMPVPPELAKNLGAPLKILVADAEDAARGILVRNLKKRYPQAEVQEAHDGFDTGKKIVDWVPNLLILDLKMPGLDALRVCAEIRQDPRFRETRVLSLAGPESSDAKKRALQTGGNDCLEKPCELKELLDKTGELLGIPGPAAPSS